MGQPRKLLKTFKRFRRTTKIKDCVKKRGGQGEGASCAAPAPRTDQNPKDSHTTGKGGERKSTTVPRQTLWHRGNGGENSNSQSNEQTERIESRMGEEGRKNKYRQREGRCADTFYLLTLGEKQDSPPPPE